MSARAVLLAVLALGVVGTAAGLVMVLLGRRAPAVGTEPASTWSLRDPQVRGLLLFLAGSMVTIGAMALWLGLN